MRIRSSLWLGLMMLSACGEQRAPVLELAGSTMGTSFSIKLPVLPPRIEADELRLEVEALLLEIEMQMSTYRIDSEISRFNVSESTEWQIVSTEFCRAAEQSLEISRISSGAFDITVGPLVNLWGFGPDGDIRNAPSNADIESAEERVGFEYLETDCSVSSIRKKIAGLYLDMSAYAKGLGVDRIAEALDQLNSQDYLVEIGGEMKLKGHNADGEKWAVAIEEPLSGERRVHAILRLTDLAVATSGDYRNFFESDGVLYSHTIDVHTGRPVTHNLASVTVIADTAAFADAMATALLALGPDDGMNLALKENIAALFLLHGESGIDELMSPDFQMYSDPNKLVPTPLIAASAQSDAVLPSLSTDLICYYNFENPVDGDDSKETDLGLSGTALDLINGGAAMRIEDAAYPGAGLSLRTQQVNPEVNGNDDWKAGVYDDNGVATLRAFNAAAGVTLMGWVKPTGTNPNPNSMSEPPDDIYNAVGLFGLLSGASDGHVVRALLEIIQVSDTPRLVALGRRDDAGGSLILAADEAWQTLLPDNTWTHLAATFDFDDGTMALYRNGELLPASYTAIEDQWKVTGPPEPDVTSATDPAGIKIGGSFPQNTAERNAFNGRFDDLMFFDRGLTAGEVQAQFARFKLGSEYILR